MAEWKLQIGAIGIPAVLTVLAWSVSADCGERGEEKSLSLLKTRNAIENLEFRDLRPYHRGMVTILSPASEGT